MTFFFKNKKDTVICFAPTIVFYNRLLKIAKCCKNINATLKNASKWLSAKSYNFMTS